MEPENNPFSPQYAGPYPRCKQGVQPPGAKSRVDNTTHICSQCGVAEGLWVKFVGHGHLPPVDQPLVY